MTSPEETIAPVESEADGSPPPTTSGTVLTMDPDTGFPNFMIINAAYGRGHSVASGALCPDEYRLFTPFIGSPDKDPIVHRRLGSKKIQEICSIDPAHPFCTTHTNPIFQRRFALTPEQIIKLAETVNAMEGRSGELLEVEWRLDPEDEEFTIVKVRVPRCEPPRRCDPIFHYDLEKENRHPLLTGTAIGPEITHGQVSLIADLSHADQFNKDTILVTHQVDKSWRSLLKDARGLITDLGGRASEAADLCREFRLPAILGSSMATHTLRDAQLVTLDCSHSELGTVYRNHLTSHHNLINIESIPTTRIQRSLSVDSPDTAQQWWQLPTRGCGMAQIEKIIEDDIGIHPMALIRYDEIEDASLRAKIDLKTAAYESRIEYFIDKLSRGIAQMAAITYPHPVVVRLNSFTSDQYNGLAERGIFEPLEQNPKLGLRGTARYLSPTYREAFDLECQAIHRARNKMGFTNLQVAIPFCRTLNEAREVIEILKTHGLSRDEDGLELHLIAEVPSNIILCEDFLRHFDCLDIDLDTLTQMVLSIDPEAEIKKTFDHLSPAVMAALQTLVTTAHRNGVPVTVFGLLEDHRPELMDYLIGAGIDSFAFEPNNFVRGSHQIAQAEKFYYEQNPINPNKP